MKDLKIKILVGFVVGLILVGTGFTSVYAYNFGVSLDDSDWAITMGLGETKTYSEGEGYVTATGGGSLENLMIKVTPTEDWTAGSEVGVDTFVLEFSHDKTNYTTITTDGVTLKDSLLPSGTDDFDLRCSAPAPGSLSGQQIITVTLTATGPSGYTFIPDHEIYYKCLGFGDYTAEGWSSAYDHEPRYTVYPESSAKVSAFEHDLETARLEAVDGLTTSYSYYQTHNIYIFPFNTIYSTAAALRTVTYEYARVAKGTGRLLDDTRGIVRYTAASSDNGDTLWTYSSGYFPRFVILD